MKFNNKDQNNSIKQLQAENLVLSYGLSTTKAGIWDWYIKDNIIHIDKPWARIFGYKDKDFKSFSFASWKSIIHPEDVKRSDQILQKHFNNETDFYDCQIRMRHKNKKWRWIHARGRVIQRDKKGNPIRLIGTHIDITAAKKAEKKLRDNEQFLAAVFESIQDGISVLTTDLTIKQTNQVMKDWYKEQLPLNNKKCFQCYRNKNNPCKPCPTLRAIRSGKTESDIVPGPSSTEFKWLELYSYPIKDRDTNKVTSIVEFVRDITKRKEAQDRLKIEKEKYQYLVENELTGIAISDLDENLIFVSHTFSEMLGYSVKQLQNMNLAQLTTEIELKKYIKQSQDRLKGQKNIYESKLIKKDGSIINVLVNASPHKNSKDEIIGTVALIIDITKRRQAQIKFKHIWEQAKDGMCLVGEDGKIINVNDSFCEMVEIEQSKLEGQPLSIIYGQTEQKNHRFHTQKIKKYTIPPRIEDKFILHNGKKRWFEIAHSIIKIPGEPEQILAIYRDINERKKQEKKRKKLELQLQQAQKMESIGRLAGGIAHDMNNMLSPIMGYSEMLQETLEKNTKERRFAKSIFQASMSAKELVGNLLAFSRKQTIKMEFIDLNKIINNFKKLLRKTIHEDIEIICKLSNNRKPIIKADKAQIEQVIMNLAVNAEDAMPEGGILTIETGFTELDQNYAASYQNFEPGEYITLYISDTGSGMDKETQDKIFEPFFSTKGSHGTGMGLATVFGIIKQHNGDIHVYSEPDKGSTFKIYLPAIEGAYIRQPQKDETSMSDTRGDETILIAEDHQNTRELARDALSSRGYKVIVAKNGQEALSKIDKLETPLNMLLTDVVMPEINGKELFSKLYQKFPGLKVLYMSGYTDDVIAQHGILETNVNYIQKPFPVKKLVLKIRKILDRTS